MESLISVIIPVYEAERTIERCLDSVLSQTYENIEAICIVDGGRDGSADILRGYAARDARVRVIEQEGKGPATARNAGLDAARGAYIGFVDADDFAEPTMYGRLLAAMREAGAQLANCAYTAFRPDGGETVKLPDLHGSCGCAQNDTKKNVPFVFVSEGAEGLGGLIADTPDFIWDKLFDAAVIRGEGLRFPDGRVYGEDTVFLVKYLSFVKRAVFIRDALYHYNAYNEGSITNTMSDRWYDIFENLKDILFFFRESRPPADFEILAPCLEGLFIRYYDRRANAMLRYGERGFQSRYVKYSFEFLSRYFPGWKARMRAMPDVVFPRVKTSLFLMRLYILAPAPVKQRLGEGRRA
ncbi:MAG: glycosyltransferase [Clostridiales Family XIII bacterium]|jgi:glycosyltransferase involved in cell wall biosynthesis|nr:glycosyltransferase [Clostridiales Family XIII bacterium]